jgi:hypothetical protein
LNDDRMPPATTEVDMDSDRPLGLVEAASLCGCPASTIEHLIELGLLPVDGPIVSDINGIRLMVSFEAAGILISRRGRRSASLRRACCGAIGARSSSVWTRFSR